MHVEWSAETVLPIREEVLSRGIGQHVASILQLHLTLLRDVFVPYISWLYSLV